MSGAGGVQPSRSAVCRIAVMICSAAASLCWHRVMSKTAWIITGPYSCGAELLCWKSCVEQRGDVVDGVAAVQPPGLARPPDHFGPDELEDLLAVLGQQHVEVEEEFGQVGVAAVRDV